MVTDHVFLHADGKVLIFFVFVLARSSDTENVRIAVVRLHDKVNPVP